VGQDEIGARAVLKAGAGGGGGGAGGAGWRGRRGRRGRRGLHRHHHGEGLVVMVMVVVVHEALLQWRRRRGRLLGQPGAGARGGRCGIEGGDAPDRRSHPVARGAVGGHGGWSPGGQQPQPHGASATFLGVSPAPAPLSSPGHPPTRNFKSGWLAVGTGRLGGGRGLLGGRGPGAAGAADTPSPPPPPGALRGPGPGGARRGGETPPAHPESIRAESDQKPVTSSFACALPMVRANPPGQERGVRVIVGTAASTGRAPAALTPRTQADPSRTLTRDTRA